MKVGGRNQLARSVVAIGSDAETVPIIGGKIVTPSVTQEASSAGSLAFVGRVVAIVKTSDLLIDK